MQKFQKILARLICWFVPSKRLRHKIRGIFEFGVVKYFKLFVLHIPSEFDHFLAVCAIAKNEGCYFREWLEFHRLGGVEKFYIYDNESSDDTREILEPYIKAGIVEYTYWPGQKQQIPAYEDCLKRHAYDSEWLAIIDLDEFIVPAATWSIPDVLKSLSPDISQLLIGWVVYGSNGHEVKPDGLVIENYNHRKAGMHFWYKAIIRARMCWRVYVHGHMCVGKTIDESGKEILRPEAMGSIPFTVGRIRVNHYYCKSWEEYQLKRSRGDAVYGATIEKCIRETFDSHDFNEVFDPIMTRYLDALKSSCTQPNNEEEQPSDF